MTTFSFISSVISSSCFSVKSQRSHSSFFCVPRSRCRATDSVFTADMISATAPTTARPRVVCCANLVRTADEERHAANFRSKF